MKRLFILFAMAVVFLIFSVRTWSQVHFIDYNSLGWTNANEVDSTFVVFGRIRALLDQRWMDGAVNHSSGWLKNGSVYFDSTFIAVPEQRVYALVIQMKHGLEKTHEMSYPKILPPTLSSSDGVEWAWRSDGSADYIQLEGTSVPFKWIYVESSRWLSLAEKTSYKFAWDYNQLSRCRARLMKIVGADTIISPWSSKYVSDQTMVEVPQPQNLIEIEDPHNYRWDPVENTTGVPGEVLYWVEMAPSKDFLEYGPPLSLYSGWIKSPKFSFPCGFTNEHLLIRVKARLHGRESAYTMLELSPTGGISNPPVAINFSLSQNYPNPFNPSTKITFTLPQPSEVSLTVYNSLGQKVAILASGRFSAGNHSVQWEASSQPGGMYFYKIEAGKFTAIKKMLLLK